MRSRLAGLSLIASATLIAGTATASTIPASQFWFDVAPNVGAPFSVLTGCTPVLSGSADGGTCGSETSGPGYAATSGGIGTDSYLPVTPGGVALGPGTAVDADSTWSSGAETGSIAKMVYSFEATGPTSEDFIPVDIISSGLAATTGDARADLSLVIRDTGGDGNIPGGDPDPDSSAPLLDLTAVCAYGSCVTSWNTPNNQLTDMLCVVNGDNYTVTITATTEAGPGYAATNSASAMIDPVIKLDPPPPASCSTGNNPLSEFDVVAGPGASTGVVASVPEPDPRGLAAFAMLAIVVLASRRRRVPLV